MPDDDLCEPIITINGHALSIGQAMTVRVAVTSWLAQLADDKGRLADPKSIDHHYIARGDEVLAMLTEVRSWTASAGTWVQVTADRQCEACGTVKAETCVRRLLPTSTEGMLCGDCDADRAASSKVEMQPDGRFRYVRAPAPTLSKLTPIPKPAPIDPRTLRDAVSTLADDAMLTPEARATIAAAGGHIGDRDRNGIYIVTVPRNAIEALPKRPGEVP